MIRLPYGLTNLNVVDRTRLVAVECPTLRTMVTGMTLLLYT